MTTFENKKEVRDDTFKKECIDIFIREISKNNVFGNFMSIPEIKAKLEKTIEYADYGKTDVGVAGFWRSSDKLIRISDEIDKDKEGLRVIIHELVHALTDGDIFGCGIRTENGRGLNEGATEWLTTEILPNYAKQNTYMYRYKNISFEAKGVYPFEQIGLKQLQALCGKEIIIQAMLENNKGIISYKVDKSEYFRSSWEYVFLYDHINELQSNITKIMNGRRYEELSNEEKSIVDMDVENICNDFKQAQGIFLDKFLMDEIREASRNQDVSKMEELKVKMKELNELKINIEGEKDINYEKYNILFVKEYLKVANKDKEPSEHVKFDDVEKYITGEEENKLSKDVVINRIKDITIEDINNFLNKEITIQDVKKQLNRVKNKAKEGIRKIKQRLTKENNEFTFISRGEEGNIYVREVSKEVIGGKNITNYEYLTEEQYIEFQNGNEVKGNILKGNIDLKKLGKMKNMLKQLVRIY